MKNRVEHKNVVVGGLFAVMMFVFSLQAQDSSAVSAQESAVTPTAFSPKVTCTGLASYEFGQIYRGVYAEAQFEHRWESRVFGDLNVTADVNKRLRIVTGLEYKMTFSQRQDNAFRASLLKIPGIFLNQAEGIITILDEKNAAPLALHCGYMLYKYNPDARNLGEYLFRSMTYPQVLFTEFDFPKVRVLGLRLHNTLWQDRIVQDLFITSAVDYFPLYDFSLAYVVSVKPIPAIEIGAGVDFDRLFPVDTVNRTPRNAYVDPINQTDTTFYSFSGTKIMARLCFDPKAFFEARIFGAEDLKVFVEMAILGLRNYPGDYGQMWQRIPLMFGINLPALRVLDVLSVQGEYYRSPYPNSYYNVMWNQLPRPYLKQGVSPSYYQEDDWKWSIYASKKILGGLSIVGQIANDHTRVDVVREEDAEYEESMRTSAYSPASLFSKGQWCWMMKLKFEF